VNRYFCRWPLDRDPEALLEPARNGVSVFPSLEGLERYLAERDIESNGCGIVILEGELTGDVDLDADAGALLIQPTRVLGMCPLD
jgi:hypothetical protein